MLHPPLTVSGNTIAKFFQNINNIVTVQLHSLSIIMSWVFLHTWVHSHTFKPKCKCKYAVADPGGHWEQLPPLS